jgi:predicted alpha/beta-fold hydrolase
VPPSIASLDLPPFRPRFPWLGGDLQTVANRLLGKTSLAAHKSERLRFALPDGTGDTLLAMLDQPATPKSGTPLVILIHGLTGSEDSSYMLSAARHLLENGYRVLRLNLRGAGPSRALCSGHYYAGRSQDFRSLLQILPPELTRDGLAAAGYSLGGAMLLKYLGEEGSAAPLVAAASVCAPIDLAFTCARMMEPRNRIYHAHILNQMKQEATGEGALLSAGERAGIWGSRSIRDYDEVFIAPRHGFGGADDYYERCKPIRFLGNIRVPTLMLAAGNDPWIPGSVYRAVDWAKMPDLLPLLPDQGGHVGFHGRAARGPWSDLAVERFFAAAAAPKRP